jgi:GntR family transcriptional regulator, arabinose operon transcriptional repressor
MNSIDRHHATPLREQLKGWILQQIQSGKLRAGDRVFSINELAQKFQISRETVRLSLDSLTAKGFLTPEHGKGYFVTQREDRVLRVAILGKIDGVYMRPIYEGLLSVLGENASIMLMDGQKNEGIRNMIESLAYHHSVDRLLVIPPRGHENLVSEQLQPFRRYFRVAWLDRAPRDCKDASFLCDYDQCVQIALERFKKKHVSRVFYYSKTPEDRSVFSQMRRAFDKNSHEFKAEMTQDVRKIVAAVKKNGFLSSCPIGVLAETDREAISIHSQLMAHGITIPEQISLISCDNSELTNLVTPAITSVDPRFNVLGQEAARWIQTDWKKQEVGAPKKLIVRPILVEKQSCI